jgi:hypothetical protein
MEDVLESGHLEHEEGWEMVEFAQEHVQCFYMNWFISYEVNNTIVTIK